MNYLGDFPTGATVYVPFHTFNAAGASVTLTGLATTDIEIYKNGVATTRASESGYTLLATDGIDFDSKTGIHGFSIDLSDNSDAGFYAAGNEYMVVVASVTVDSQTVNFVAATFSIERAGGALALLKNATYGLSAIETLVDDLESRLTAARAGYLDNINNAALATTVAQTGDAFARLGAPAGASVSADIADLPTVTEFNARTLVAADYTVVSDLPAAPDNAGIAAILEDTGTTLDTLIKDIPTVAEFEARTIVAANYFDPAADVVAHVTLVDTTTTLTNMPAAAPSASDIKTAMEADGGKLDHLWEMTEDDAGVRRLTTNALEQAPTGGSAPTVAQIRAEMDANSTQLAAIVADTGELQTDWHDGGRLDVLLDAAAAGGGLDAVGVRTAIGMSSANLDTQLAAVAKTGADGDTLKTLSDQIDGVQAGSGLTAQQTRDAMKLAPTAGAPAAGSIDAELDAIRLVTDEIDVSAVTQAPANNAGELTFTVGVTFDETPSGMTIPATWTTCYFTLKRDKESDADSASLIQIKVTNGGDASDGLIYLNGSAIASPITKADASLTVTQAAGTVRIFISDNALALLTGGLSDLDWDLKVFVTGGTSTLLTSDKAAIVWTPTRAV